MELCPWIPPHSDWKPKSTLLSSSSLPPHSLLFSNLHPTTQACLLTLEPSKLCGHFSLCLCLFICLECSGQGIPMACNTVFSSLPKCYFLGDVFSWLCLLFPLSTECFCLECHFILLDYWFKKNFKSGKVALCYILSYFFLFLLLSPLPSAYSSNSNVLHLNLPFHS